MVNPRRVNKIPNKLIKYQQFDRDKQLCCLLNWPAAKNFKGLKIKFIIGYISR